MPTLDVTRPGVAHVLLVSTVKQFEHRFVSRLHIWLCRDSDTRDGRVWIKNGSLLQTLP